MLTAFFVAVISQPLQTHFVKYWNIKMTSKCIWLGAGDTAQW
jgi:hypothetical protein